MAIKEAKTNTDLDALFTQLAEPFDPNADQVARYTHNPGWKPGRGRCIR